MQKVAVNFVGWGYNTQANLQNGNNFALKLKVLNGLKMNNKTKNSVESDLVVSEASDKFYFNFEGNVILYILAGIIVFFLIYACSDNQLQEEICTKPLNSDVWFFSKLLAFVSLLLYLVIGSTLGRKTADKGYEFEIKYAPIRPILNVLLIFSFVSIGLMLGIFLLILAR